MCVCVCRRCRACIENEYIVQLCVCVCRNGKTASGARRGAGVCVCVCVCSHIHMLTLEREGLQLCVCLFVCVFVCVRERENTHTHMLPLQGHGLIFFIRLLLKKNDLTIFFLFLTSLAIFLYVCIY